MGSSDFYIDYNLEVSETTDEFKRETEQRLRELANSHSDIVGAAVALEKTVDTQSYDLYRVRIVLYKRAKDIVVDKEDADPMVTLREALQTLEEQVRAALTQASAPPMALAYLDLDHLLSGLQPSALVIVGARPAMGKTSFALGMLAHAAKLGAENRHTAVRLAREKGWV